MFWIFKNLENDTFFHSLSVCHRKSRKNGFVKNQVLRGCKIKKIKEEIKDNNKLEQPQVKDNEDEYVIPKADGAQSDSSSED